MIGMCIGVCPAWHSGDNCVMVCKARQLEISSILELMGRQRLRSSTTTCNISRCNIMGKIVLRNDFKGLLKDLP